MKVEFWNGHEPHQTIEGNWNQKQLEEVFRDLWYENEHIVLVSGHAPFGRQTIK